MGCKVADTTATQYIHGNGLGGAMWWELSGDHTDPLRAIVPRVAHEVSGDGQLVRPGRLT